MLSGDTWSHFLRRIIDLTLGLQQPHHRRRLNGEARADLEARSTFVDHFNGKSMFLPDRWLTSASLNLFTDSSNSGFGGYLGNKWFAGVWSGQWENFHITIKELFPIFLGGGNVCESVAEQVYYLSHG